MTDCGCGGGKNCVSKKAAENLMVSFVKAQPQFNRKSKRALAKFISGELKTLDCGCGCKGVKGFRKKYNLVGGGVLGDCPVEPDGTPWRNDGLTCVEPCKKDEFDDGLTCRKRCPSSQIDDGLTCRVPITSSMTPCPDGSKDIAGTCWGKVRQDCVDDCFNHPAPGCRTYECGRLRGAFGEDWGPKLCTDCNLRCGQTCWDVQGITKQLHERNLKLYGGEVYGQMIRGKRITVRIKWDVLLKDLVQGLKDFTEGKIDYAALFDPEKNGVGAAFRKFGADSEAAFKDIGERMLKAFDPNQNGVGKAFADFAKIAEANLEQFGKDFVDKCKDPDMWVQVITIMAQVAGGILAAAIAVGTLGAGTGLAIGLGMALNAVGPAVKMIADAARGKPIDALDIVQLAIAVVPPLPGTGVVMGEGIRNAIKYGNYAATAGKIIVAGVQAGQALGVVPSTCITNCPPAPVIDNLPPEDDAPGCAGLTSKAIMELQPDGEGKQFIRINKKYEYKTVIDPETNEPKQEVIGFPNPAFKMTPDDWEADYRAKHCGPPSAAPTAAPPTIAANNQDNDEEPNIELTSPDDEEPNIELTTPDDGEPDFDFTAPDDGEPDFDFTAPDDEEGPNIDFTTPEEKTEDFEAVENAEIKDVGKPMTAEEFLAPASAPTPEKKAEPMTAKEFLAPASTPTPEKKAEPMTAEEFLAPASTPTPEKKAEPMTAKEFLAPAPVPKPTPKVLNEVNATRFLAPNEPVPNIPQLNIVPQKPSAPPPPPPPPAPMTAKQFLAAPPREFKPPVLPPLKKQGNIDKAVAKKEPVNVKGKKKNVVHFTPADLKFYMRRGGAGEDGIAAQSTGDPRTFVNPYTGTTAKIEDNSTPRNVDGTEFDPKCYAKNYPDLAKSLDNDEAKLKNWWISKGHDAGDDATCGTFISNPDERVAFMNTIKAKKTVCDAAGYMWDDKTNTCDESRNADGTKNLNFEKCKRKNGYWNKGKCSLFRNQRGEYQPGATSGVKGKQIYCSVFGDYTNPEGSATRCDVERNVDGSYKTKSDACVTSDCFWDEDKQVCNVQLDAYGNPKTEKDLCEYGDNFWDGSKCDQTRDLYGDPKQDECEVDYRGFATANGCTGKLDKFPTTFAGLTAYVNDKTSRAEAGLKKNKAMLDEKKIKDDAEAKRIKEYDDLRAKEIAERNKNEKELFRFVQGTRNNLGALTDVLSSADVVILDWIQNHKMWPFDQDREASAEFQDFKYKVYDSVYKNERKADSVFGPVTLYKNPKAVVSKKRFDSLYSQISADRIKWVPVDFTYKGEPMGEIHYKLPALDDPNRTDCTYGYDANNKYIRTCPDLPDVIGILQIPGTSHNIDDDYYNALKSKIEKDTRE